MTIRKKIAAVKRRKTSPRKNARKPVRASRVYRIPEGYTHSYQNKGGDWSTTFHYGRGHKTIKLPAGALYKSGNGQLIRLETKGDYERRYGHLFR